MKPPTLSAIYGTLNSPPPASAMRPATSVLQAPFCPSIKSVPSLYPAVSEFPSATYFEKLAVPDVSGNPSDDSATVVTSVSFEHATMVKATKHSHFMFLFIMIYILKFKIYLGVIVHDA